MFSALLALCNAEPITLGAAENKKEISSLRPQRLCGDNKMIRIKVIYEVFDVFLCSYLSLSVVCYQKKFVNKINIEIVLSYAVAILCVCDGVMVYCHAYIPLAYTIPYLLSPNIFFLTCIACM